MHNSKNSKSKSEADLDKEIYSTSSVYIYPRDKSQPLSDSFKTIDKKNSSDDNSNIIPESNPDEKIGKKVTFNPATGTEKVISKSVREFEAPVLENEVDVEITDPSPDSIVIKIIAEKKNEIKTNTREKIHSKLNEKFTKRIVEEENTKTIILL